MKGKDGQRCTNYPCEPSKVCYIHSKAPKKQTFLKKMKTGFDDLNLEVMYTIREFKKAMHASFAMHDNNC
jgi:hypothetical protein